MKSRPPDGLLLFGLSNRALDVVLTVLVASTVVVSRFGFLANGPWEWDETLFARGILHFELAAHFPQPPGFPGWLAIGQVMDAITGDPLLGLQLASAAFSVAALWVLAALGRRVAPPAVAASAALAVLAAPGPWLYAVRGFTTTAASVLALAAAAVLTGGLRGARVTAFTLLISASFLVRPHLLPALALLWLAGVLTVRPWRRALPGVAVGVAGGLAGGLLAVGLMVRAEGGWEAFVTPFIVHSERHFSRLSGNIGGYAELGLVKGLGGVTPATAVFVLALVGLVVWSRRLGKRPAALWLAVLLVSVGQLVWLQNRTYGRYAVGVQMALAPLVAAAGATVPPAAACAGLLGLAGWFGARSLPVVTEQHETQLAAWRAVREARRLASAEGLTVVLEPELHPFASYLWHLLEERGEPTPPWVLSPWAPEPWTGVENRWLLATVHRHLYPGSLRGIEHRWGSVSPSLRPLTQQRMLEAWVIEDAPLPVGSWWPAEHGPDDRRFMWFGADAGLVMPPMAPSSMVSISVSPAAAPDPVRVRWCGADVVSVDGEGGEERVWLSASVEAVGRVTTLGFERATTVVPGGGDERPLAARLYEVREASPERAWRGEVARDWQRDALGVEIEGLFAAEDFGAFGQGAWLAPKAVVRLPAAAGRVRLTLWAPRPTPSRSRFVVAGREAAGPVDVTAAPMVVELEVRAGEAADGIVEIEVFSDPYLPSDHGLADRRELGVVLSSVSYEPLRGGLDALQGGP